MTAEPRYEVPVSDNVLLSFDGRVLEVFGYVDDARYHIWEEPRVEFSTPRHRVTIIVRSGRKHTVPYDARFLPGLQALADRVARSVAERPRP